MIKRIATAALLAAALPLHASAEPAPAPDLVKVALETDKGRIVLALNQRRAPATTGNFLAYVDKGWFNGQPFYRAFKYGSGGIIQGGVRDGAKQLAPIAHESTAQTGLSHVAGTIAMANFGPGTARSDFFILTADVPAFDANQGNIGFAPFGRVVEGMEVVNAILASPVSPTKGEGVMKGQMLEPAIKIVRARRID